MPSIFRSHSQRAVRRSGHIVYGRADSLSPVSLDGTSSDSITLSSVSMQSSSSLLSSSLPSSSVSISSAVPSSAPQLISSSTTSAGNSSIPSIVTPSSSQSSATSSSALSASPSLGTPSVSPRNSSSISSVDNASTVTQSLNGTTSSSTSSSSTNDPSVTSSTVSLGRFFGPSTSSSVASSDITRSTTSIPTSTSETFISSSAPPTSSSSTSVTSSTTIPKTTSPISSANAFIGPSIGNNASSPSSSSSASSSSTSSIPPGIPIIGTSTPTLIPGAPVTTLSAPVLAPTSTPSTSSSAFGTGQDFPTSQSHSKTPIILAGIFGSLGAFIILTVLLFLWKHRRVSGTSSPWGSPNSKMFPWRREAGLSLPIQMPTTTAQRQVPSAPVISRPLTTYSNGMLGPMASSTSLGSTSSHSTQSNTDVSPRLMLDTKRLTLQRLEGNPRYTLGSSPSDAGDDPFADPLAISRARGLRMEPSPTIRASDASSSVYSTSYAAPEASTSNTLPNPFSDPEASRSQGRGPTPSPRPWQQGVQGHASPSNLRYEYAGYAV